MKAIIMAGGEGSRLRPLTETTPKPLVTVCGRPCITYALDMLHDAGISEAIVTLRYRAEDVIRALGSSWKGMKISYSVEDEPLGTAGSVRKCADFLAGEENFVVTSGDSVCAMDLAGAVEFHNSKRARATLLLTRTRDVLEYGVVVTGDDAGVLRFIEKPAWGQAFSDTVNTGTYVLDASVLEMIPEGEEFDFGRDLFPMLEREHAPIYGYEAQGYWYDIGDPESLLNCTLEINGGSYIAETGEIGFGALVLDSVIMEGASVGRSCSIERCIIAAGSSLPAGISLHDSVWYDGRAYPMLRVSSDYDLGLCLACSCTNKGRIGVGGKRRAEILRGIVDGGGNARDLGDAEARLCAFAAREYGLECSVWAGSQTVIFDEQGLAASRSFTRSLKNGVPAQTKGTITELSGLEARYVHSLASSIDRIDGLRFSGTDALVRRALEKQGGVFDPSERLYVTGDALSGFDLWHLCGIIVANGEFREIALPYIAPAALVSFAEERGITVRRYAIIPFDDSEADIRSVVRDNAWLCDEGAAAVRVIGIIHQTGRTIEALAAELPDFKTVERSVRSSKRTRLTVMKKFGAPDGEGVIRVYSTGRVRAIPDARGLRLIAEAASFEAANELLGLSSNEIRNLIRSKQ